MCHAITPKHLVNAMWFTMPMYNTREEPKKEKETKIITISSVFTFHFTLLFLLFSFVIFRSLFVCTANNIFILELRYIAWRFVVAHPYYVQSMSFVCRTMEPEYVGWLCNCSKQTIHNILHWRRRRSRKKNEIVIVVW